MKMNTGKRKLLVMLILTFLLIPIQMGSVQPNYGQSLGTSRPSLSKSDIYDIESQSNSMTSNNFDRKPSQSLQSITSYTDHIPISILNDSAFGSSGYNFNGSGSQNDPYLITNYRIIDSSGILIHVENTTANFVIQDCILDGITEVHTGIYLRNVTAGTISRNVLSNNYHGCYLSAYSSNNVIKNNRMSNTSSTTIILSTSGSNDIFDNEIQSSKGHGIYVGPYSGGNRIFRNTITDIALSGVFFKSDSHYGDAINNTGRY
jgi:parallel beta-helix repeat protein